MAIAKLERRDFSARPRSTNARLAIIFRKPGVFRQWPVLNLRVAQKKRPQHRGAVLGLLGAYCAERNMHNGLG
jgi:hypothetical protein